MFMLNPLTQFSKSLLGNLPKYIQSVFVTKDSITIYVSPNHLRNVLYFLRDNTNSQYKSLMDICAIDYPAKEKRFELVYVLLSVKYNTRICVKTYTDELTPVPTVSDIFSSADWYERECWDLYGISFANHPDLRRILTDYGFNGYPFRKDFPLSGYVEVCYDDEQKKVIYKPLELAQEFRHFQYQSAWDWK